MLKTEPPLTPYGLTLVQTQGFPSFIPPDANHQLIYANADWLHTGMHGRVALLVAVLTVLAGCTDGAAPTDSPSPQPYTSPTLIPSSATQTTPSATSTPSPTATETRPGPD